MINRKREGILFAVFSAILFVLSGCSSVEPKLVRTPVPTSEQIIAIESSESCKHPALPTDSKSLKEWRYGCFCGKGYPNYQSVEEYYSVKPKDSIDEICRDHDICWMKHGELDGDCNGELVERAFYLDDYFTSNDMDDCSNVTGDISGAFVSIFVDDKFVDKPGADFGAKVGKAATTPLMGVGFVLRMFLVAVNGYPERHQKCNVERKNESNRVAGGI